MEKQINKDMTNYRLELKNTHPKYSNENLDEIIKTKQEEVKSEILEYIREFMKLFQQSTFNKAIEYINFLKKEIKHYPKHLAKYLKKNFFPEYRKYLKFLKEYYNCNTMPKYEKKYYKTIQGLWSAFIHKKEGGLKEEIKT